MKSLLKHVRQSVSFAIPLKKLVGHSKVNQQNTNATIPDSAPAVYQVQQKSWKIWAQSDLAYQPSFTVIFLLSQYTEQFCWLKRPTSTFKPHKKRLSAQISHGKARFAPDQ